MYNWTLFLDRDGVINVEPPVEQVYVNHLSQFYFYPDSLEAIRIVAPLFQHIVIATNQRGVGKGVTPKEELYRIFDHLQQEVTKAGGRIDKIYFAPELETDHPNRKPNTGMALQAKRDFPEIEFSRSIMVGNNPSDMQFGRNLGMKTIFVTTTMPSEKVEAGLCDYHFASLYEAALFLQEKMPNLL